MSALKSGARPRSNTQKPQSAATGRPMWIERRVVSGPPDAGGWGVLTGLGGCLQSGAKGLGPAGAPPGRRGLAWSGPREGEATERPILGSQRFASQVRGVYEAIGKVIFCFLIPYFARQGWGSRAGTSCESTFCAVGGGRGGLRQREELCEREPEPLVPSELLILFTVSVALEGKQVCKAAG